MDPDERRRLGAHYTTEQNILKLLRPLALDALRADFATAVTDPSGEALRALQRRLAALHVLDPACGAGNFLVITYRELRLLELDILLALRSLHLAVEPTSRLDLSQLHGIEIDATTARVAEAALRHTDDQLNLRLHATLGSPPPPHRPAPRIHVANALRIDWAELLPAGRCSFILGNPPFVGKHYQSPQQREDLAHTCPRGAGDLDYAAAWFFKAARYMQGTRAAAAFVTTNSVTQGEQVPALWSPLLAQVHLHFAHRTFPWRSEARGAAHVHVVIIGFGPHDRDDRRIFETSTDFTQVPNISPYLTAGPNVVVEKSRRPPHAPPMRCGNKPADDGNFILATDDEREQFLAREPGARRLVRRYLGSEELLHGTRRWCLWLADATPGELALPAVQARVEAVRRFRLASSAAPTRKAAATPARFFFRSQPDTTYLAVPEVSSGQRRYIPIAFLPADTIASNKLYVVPGADLLLFGLLASAMHMAWVRTLTGRLKSDFQYSASMLYNTFPWPHPADTRRDEVEQAARAVLAARPPDTPLADLYDPRQTPPALAAAHAALDRAVDRCYRPDGFTGERPRFEHLLALYGQAATAARTGR